MCRANPLWGAPRVHGELAKLGISISEAAVSKYMIRHRRPPSQTWRSFSRHHVMDLVSVAFFTLPTVTFRILFVFIVSPSRSSADRSFQRDAAFLRGVDRATNGRCLSLGFGAALPAARSGSNLWSVFRPSRGGSRGRAGRYRTALPVVKSIRRKSHWYHSPRLSRPLDRSRRAAPEANPTRKCRLLSFLPDPFVA